MNATHGDVLPARPLVDRRLLVLLAVVAALHLALCVYDLSHPGAFLTGDRSPGRMGLITCLQQGQPVVSVLAHNGLAGDYILHGMLYLAGGRMAVIAVQIALFLALLVALYGITGAVAGGGWAPLLATLSYAALPNMIVAPHQLVTEGFFLPMLVISFFFLSRYVLEDGPVAPLLASGLSLSVVVFVRQLTLLWPCLVVVLLLLARPSWRRVWHGAAFLAASWSLLLLWMSFMYVQTGEFTTGKSVHDLARNLYDRTEHIMALVPPDRQPEMRSRYLVSGGPADTHRLELSGYARFVSQNPLAYLRYLGADAAVYAVKGEANRLFVDYLPRVVHSEEWDREKQLGGVPDWRTQLKRGGPLKTLAGLYREGPAFLLVNVGGSLLFLVFVCGAIVGFFRARRLARDAGPPGRFLLIWLLVAAYIYPLLVSQAAPYVPSRFRAPGEFAIAVFFGIALAALPVFRGRGGAAAVKRAA